MVTKFALDRLGVDEMGLSDADRKYLDVVRNQYNGGPVGVENIAAALTEDVGTITDVYEPFLMKKGLVKRTPRLTIISSGVRLKKASKESKSSKIRSDMNRF